MRYQENRLNFALENANFGIAVIRTHNRKKEVFHESCGILNILEAVARFAGTKRIYPP